MTVVYSEKSQAAFDSLDPRHQRILLYIKDVLEIDHSVLCGFRGEAEQTEAYLTGASELKWPQSLHNGFPSLAVDVVPYTRIPSAKGGVHWHHEDPKIKEDYYREMVRFATIYQFVGKLIFNTEIRWGGDWGKDWSLMDNKFNDYPHLEIADGRN